MKSAPLRVGRMLTLHPFEGAAELLLGAYWLPQKTKQLWGHKHT